MLNYKRLTEFKLPAIIYIYIIVSLNLYYSYMYLANGSNPKIQM